MRTTRTHTHFFAGQDVANVLLALDALSDDWNSRRPHIDAEIARRGDERIAAVRLTVARLTDRAD